MIFLVRIATWALVGAVALVMSNSLSAGDQRRLADPGKLPQTAALPSSSTPRFRARMAALWRGLVDDSPAAAQPAFFPRSVYLQVKQISNPASDYRDRLLRKFSADIHAAHLLLGRQSASASLAGVRVPREWAWITPGYCFNRVGYWHAQALASSTTSEAVSVPSGSPMPSLFDAPCE